MKSISVSLILLISLSVNALGGVSVPDHSEWNSLLQRYVTSAGAVDYEGLKKDNRFSQYLLILEGSHPDDSWSKGQKKAYWINTYNAFTVKLIIDNLPLKSIRDIENPWKKEFIKIEGKSYSLDHIENKILRPVFGDPRIHFAINCASASCPPLLNRAYIPSTLDSQLDKVTRAFMNDSRFNQVNDGAVSISPIFDWFSVDFESKGGVREYFNKYSRTPIPGNAIITFTDYDWSLNDR